MEKELEKELNQRGTAEISGGIVNQVTQALDENDAEVEFLLFGEKVKQKIIPIDEACAKCDFWKGQFATEKECQECQAEDAKARGFQKLICPEQFVD
jgi:hypothetical protein